MQQKLFSLQNVALGEISYVWATWLPQNCQTAEKWLLAINWKSLHAIATKNHHCAVLQGKPPPPYPHSSAVVTYAKGFGDQMTIILTQQYQFSFEFGLRTLSAPVQQPATQDDTPEC